MKKNEIFDELKKRIIFFDYMPNQVLNIKELSKEFGVSPVPVRDALLGLEKEKLVSIVPNNVAYVSNLTFQEFKDISEIRIFLLSIIGKLAAINCQDKDIEEMKALLEKIKQETNQKNIIILDYQFHDLLNRSTGNKVLVEVMENLRNRVGRLWYLAEKGKEYSTQIPKDFSEIIDALEEKNGKKCVKILQQHAISFIKRIKNNLYDEEFFNKF
jgi:DNA-binding GntR family transcriptional regulator